MAGESSSIAAMHTPVLQAVGSTRSAERHHELRSSAPVAPSAELLGSAANGAAQTDSVFDKSISFDIASDAKTLIVKVVDNSTQEVVRTIPGEETIALSQRIDQFLGQMFDRTS